MFFVFQDFCSKKSPEINICPNIIVFLIVSITLQYYRISVTAAKHVKRATVVKSCLITSVEGWSGSIFIYFLITLLSELKQSRL